MEGSCKLNGVRKRVGTQRRKSYTFQLMFQKSKPPTVQLCTSVTQREFHRRGAQHSCPQL